MKKLFIGLMALALAFTAVVSLTGCSPTAGLDEVTLEDIANADMSGTYSCVTKTITYNSDGSVKSTDESDPVEKSAAEVKAEITGSKALTTVISALTSKASGRVCANRKYTKIVTYAYTRDSSDRLTSEVIVTYRKI